ncbi:hypothetical protein DVH24_016757 [Malus domestica]|uniref:Uncharacterized protein n=1 Tax=Malus domestica TaxID=3750 RepID=A0A498HWJ2_MALDO|nr:hypothetical protein DVH24_016757 [Malus domestica]
MYYTLPHEVFWELTGFGFHRNSEVKQFAQVRASSRKSNPMMGDPLGSSRVSSHKQNRGGVVRAQSGQYRATAESSPRCGEGPDRDVTV